MIAKDFHFTKDFRQIGGKSFVIKGTAAASGGLSSHTRQALGPVGTMNSLFNGIDLCAMEFTGSDHAHDQIMPGEAVGAPESEWASRSVDLAIFHCDQWGRGTGGAMKALVLPLSVAQETGAV
jgi:hypothetical protein